MKKIPKFYIENIIPFLIFLLIFSFGTYFFSTKYLSDNFYDWMLRLTNTASAPNDVVIVAGGQVVEYVVGLEVGAVVD